MHCQKCTLNEVKLQLQWSWAKLLAATVFKNDLAYTFTH